MGRFTAYNAALRGATAAYISYYPDLAVPGTPALIAGLAARLPG